MQDFSVFIANHLGLTYAFAIVVVLLLIVEGLRAKRATFRINVSQAVSLINRENAVIIDVRSIEQYRKGHLLDAISIPAQQFSLEEKKIEKFRKKPIILVCNTGVDSQKLAASLLKKGYNAFSLNGGVRAWADANLPIIKD